MSLEDMLSPAQLDLLWRMGNREEIRCWTHTYEWRRWRVRFDEWILDGWESADGPFTAVSRQKTGRSIWTHVHVWLWQRWKLRKEIPFRRRRLPVRLPQARLLR